VANPLDASPLTPDPRRHTAMSDILRGAAILGLMAFGIVFVGGGFFATSMSLAGQGGPISWVWSVAWVLAACKFTAGEFRDGEDR